MSDRHPSNRRRAPARDSGSLRKSNSVAVPSAKRKVIEAPLDPFLSDEDSPLLGTATTTVRPPNGTKPIGATSRWMRTLQLVAGVTVVIAASCAVAWGARRYVMTSPRFAVRTVLVDGERRRTASHVASAGGIAVGKNIFALDLVAAGEMLKQDPWIENAIVMRKLPSTVSITVVEREAYALAAIGGALYLSTRDGDLFKKLSDDDPSDLPLVTGITAEWVSRDRAGVVLAVKRVLDVAEDIARTGIGKRYPIQELHIEKDGSLVAIIGKDAIGLHLGLPPYRDKIEQASRILNELLRRKANASVVFLDNDAHPERVVVRMR